ncbi:hypothetical protein HKBW3S06_01724, partial [Candidatus Hakubella thermalkaliphila]
INVGTQWRSYDLSTETENGKLKAIDLYKKRDETVRRSLFLS